MNEVLRQKLLQAVKLAGGFHFAPRVPLEDAQKALKRIRALEGIEVRPEGTYDFFVYGPSEPVGVIGTDGVEVLLSGQRILVIAFQWRQDEENPLATRGKFWINGKAFRLHRVRWEEFLERPEAFKAEVEKPQAGILVTLREKAEVEEPGSPLAVIRVSGETKGSAHLYDAWDGSEVEGRVLFASWDLWHTRKGDDQIYQAVNEIAGIDLREYEFPQPAKAESTASFILGERGEFIYLYRIPESDRLYTPKELEELGWIFEMYQGYFHPSSRKYFRR